MVSKRICVNRILKAGLTPREDCPEPPGRCWRLRDLWWRLGPAGLAAILQYGTTNGIPINIIGPVPTCWWGSGLEGSCSVCRSSLHQLDEVLVRSRLAASPSCAAARTMGAGLQASNF
jgi:hypothetical protein